jgi:predicted CoA-substrate-specific enzyme activase
VKTGIICHGKGAYFTNRRIRTVIDIGGQSSTAVLLDDKGRIKDFAINDGCAAGTGRFLEVMAGVLNLDIKKFGFMSRQSDKPVRIRSACTVFTESNIISLISKNVKTENIVAGIHNALAASVAAMAQNIDITSPVMLTGGVTKNVGAVDAIKKKIDAKIIVPRKGHVCGAIGAAIMAVNRDLLLC